MGTTRPYLPQQSPLVIRAANFLTRARLVHGDRFHYENVTYLNKRTKITIICPIHGDFAQTPADHLRGYGCGKCANKHQTTVDFIVKAERLHGKRYSYEMTDYRTSKEKVKIICRKHGVFEQRPNQHLNGDGCPECGREITRLSSLRHYTFENDPTHAVTQGQLYLLLITTETAQFLKVGVTRKTVKERTRKWEVPTRQLLSYPGRLYDLLLLEQHILVIFRYHKYVPKCLPDGYTECFSMGGLLDLCEYIDNFNVGQNLEG
jgi:hypothetical protein